MACCTAPGLWCSLTGMAIGSPYQDALRQAGLTLRHLFLVDLARLWNASAVETKNAAIKALCHGVLELESNKFILVHGRESRVLGEFNLTVEAAILESADQCDAAIGPLSSNSLATLGTWTNACFNDLGRCAEVDLAGPSVWHTVIGDGKELMASTRGVSLNSGARIAVFAGTCDNLLCLDIAASTNCGEQMWVSWDSNLNELYHILGYRSTRSQGNSFKLKVDEAPSNLRCTDVTEFAVSAGSTTMGETEVALSEDETFCKQGPATDLGSWHSFAGESDSRFSVSACSEFTDFQIQLSAFRGDCNNLECVAFNNGISCGSGSYVTWDAVMGQNYYILAPGSPSLQISGNFAVTVGFENDLCATAIGPLPTDDSGTLGGINSWGNKKRQSRSGLLL